MQYKTGEKQTNSAQEGNRLLIYLSLLLHLLLPLKIRFKAFLVFPLFQAPSEGINHPQTFCSSNPPPRERGIQHIPTGTAPESPNCDHHRALSTGSEQNQKTSLATPSLAIKSKGGVGERGRKKK